MQRDEYITIFSGAQALFKILADLKLPPIFPLVFFLVIVYNHLEELGGG